MTYKCDAVVVGAGLNGAATAFFLAQKGLNRIVVLDADNVGSGASGAAVGLLRSHYDNRPETELAAKSLPWFRNWNDLVGGDCGWLPTGFFRFVETDEIDNMRANVAVQRCLGEQVEILDPREARRIAPQFDVEGIGAVVYEPNSGTADNRLAAETMLRQACSMAAEFWAFTPALAIEFQGERVSGVATSRGSISAPVVVLTAGVACKDLAKIADFELPLTSKTIRVAEIVPPPSMKMSVSYMDPVSDSWLTPRPQDRAIIAVPPPSPPRMAHPNFDRDEALSGLVPVARRLPGIENSTIVGWWSRSDCFAPDGKPIVGAVEGRQGLYVNTAGAGKGHKVAPAAAQALSELIMDGCATTADIGPFRLERFSSSPTAWSSSEYRKRVIG